MLRRPAVIGGIVVAALSLGAAVMLIREGISSAEPGRPASRSSIASEGDREESLVVAPSASPPGPSESQLPSVLVHVNEVGGWLFSYPSAWELDREASFDRLTDPSGNVAVTFDVAPPGELQSASEDLVAELTKDLSDVKLDTGPIERTPQGLPSLVVGGRGIGSGGAPARFLVITIQGPDGNRAIAVHFSPDAEPLEALPAIREVIASYRISTAD